MTVRQHLQPDDPVVPVLEEVAREAASVRAVGEALAANMARLEERIEGAHLVDSREISRLLDRVAGAGGEAVKSGLAASVRATLLKTGGALAVAGLALAAGGVAVGFRWGKGAACPVEQVQEWRGGLVCTIWMRRPPPEATKG